MISERGLTTSIPALLTRMLITGSWERDENHSLVEKMIAAGVEISLRSPGMERKRGLCGREVISDSRSLARGIGLVVWVIMTCKVLVEVISERVRRSEK